jgi:nitrite reductase (NAD(P)H)
MGVDVASFGDFFADKMLSNVRSTRIETPVDLHMNKGQAAVQISVEDASASSAQSSETAKIATAKKRGRKPDEPIKCLVYKDPFSGTYKKYIFTADGKHLLGGMMVGDVGDYVRLVAIVKKKVKCFLFSRGCILNYLIQKSLEVAPSEFIIGKKEGADNGEDLDDDTQICSCHVSAFVERSSCF